MYVPSHVAGERDSADLTGIAIGIAIGVLCALAAGVLVVRTRRSADRRVNELTEQLRRTAAPLAEENLSELDFQSIELASSLDPADVIDRALDQVVSLPGVDAALIAIEARDDQGNNGSARTHAAGLSEDEIERTLLNMPAHPDLRTIEVVYRYRLEDVNETSRLPRAALTVALRADGETIGSLAAISRSAQAPFTAPTHDALEAVARRAGPAIWNALRFTEARELAELDPLTGLHNRRLFFEFLARENRPRAPLRALGLADRLRPRRFQADQRPDRPPGR